MALFPRSASAPVPAAVADNIHVRREGDFWPEGVFWPQLLCPTPYTGTGAAAPGPAAAERMAPATQSTAPQLNALAALSAAAWAAAAAVPPAGISSCVASSPVRLPGADFCNRRCQP